MSRPAYNFRIVPEIIFAIVVAAAIAVAQILIDFDASVFAGDPAGFWSMIAGAVVRAGAGALLTVLTRGAFLGPGETPTRPTTG